MKTVYIDKDRNIILKIGQNAQENAYMVHKAGPDDIWFHLSKFPSPHGLLSFPPDTDITDEIIITCCQQVKALSKHKHAPRISMDVLPAKYVKNIPTQIGAVTLLKQPNKVHV